jgi:predicted N-acyltransferase
LADHHEQCIAGSLMFCSDSTLYGRHWGCTEYVDKLHFEACYYQGIEYCIKHQISLFEPGAQGEHKVSRGFVPTLTRSSHWLTKNPFQQAIERYVVHEQETIADYMQSCCQHLPYKNKL